MTDSRADHVALTVAETQGYVILMHLAISMLTRSSVCVTEASAVTEQTASLCEMK